MNDVLQQVLDYIPAALKGYPVLCKVSSNKLSVVCGDVVLANIDFYHTKTRYIYNLWIPFDNYMDMKLRNKVIDKLRTYLEMMGFNKL